MDAAEKTGATEAAPPSCWVCGTAARPTQDFAPVRLSRCPECGFLFQPELPVEDLRRSHDDSYFEDYAASGDHAQRRLEARIRLRWMRGQGCKAGRLLEVGPAQGAFLAEARRRGFAPVGIEPEPSTAEVARRRSGVDVIVGWAEEVELPPASFDIVCLWHVVEHIPRPRRVLEALNRSLKPGGRLFCEVPNTASRMARIQRERWDGLDPGHHVGFFDPHTLRRALTSTGYAEVETETIPTFRYAPLDATTVLRRVPRRLEFSVRAGVRPLAPHPWKQDLLRAVASRPA